MNAAELKEARAAVHRLPKCSGCGSHIGTGASICGACKNPQPLTWLELMKLGRLVRRHWGSGVLRELVMHSTYRPTLSVTAHFSVVLCEDRRLSREAHLKIFELANDALNERAELADLYDRSQAQRGLRRRAVRI
jgi:hypothetical protein